MEEDLHTSLEMVSPSTVDCPFTKFDVESKSQKTKKKQSNKQNKTKQRNKRNENGAYVESRVTVVLIWFWFDFFFQFVQGSFQFFRGSIRLRFERANRKKKINEESEEEVAVVGASWWAAASLSMAVAMATALLLLLLLLHFSSPSSFRCSFSLVPTGFWTLSLVVEPQVRLDFLFLAQPNLT